MRISKQVSDCTYNDDCETCTFIEFCKHWGGKQTSDEQERYYRDCEEGRTPARPPARDRDQVMMEV